MEDHAGRLDRGADGEFPSRAWSLVWTGRALWSEDGHRGRGGGSVEDQWRGREGGRERGSEGVKEEKEEMMVVEGQKQGCPC